MESDKQHGYHTPWISVNLFWVSQTNQFPICLNHMLEGSILCEFMINKQLNVETLEKNEEEENLENSKID